MAIQKTLVSSRFGQEFTFANAYCFAQGIKVEQRDVRVADNEQGQPVFAQKWIVTFDMLCYVSQAAKNAREEPFMRVPVAAEVPDGNTLNANSLAYFLAKELALFSGATDV